MRQWRGLWQVRGAPKGNKYHETQGIVALRNSIRKRSKRHRFFIDLRSNSGQSAIAVQAGIIADLAALKTYPRRRAHR